MKKKKKLIIIFCFSLIIGLILIFINYQENFEKLTKKYKEETHIYQLNMRGFDERNKKTLESGYSAGIMIGTEKPPESPSEPNYKNYYKNFAIILFTFIAVNFINFWAYKLKNNKK